MKTNKLLTLASVVLILCLLLSLSVGASDNPEPTGYNQALINVCDYGAIPNDGKDDTSAFTLTLNMSNDCVYVPPGTYNVSESLIVYATTLIGSGTDKTVIIADIDKVRDPILWVGDSSQIRDITVKFADHCVNGTEISGERCGIITTAKGLRRFCKGGAISNVRIENVGTGIYSPITEAIADLRPATGTGDGNNGNWTGDAICFSSTFEGVSVIDFSFRGISMESIGRTGNIWRNIYLSSGKYEANTALYFYNDESESAMTEITVANSKLKNGVRFIQNWATQITNLNFINTELIEDNTAFLYSDESNIVINGLNFENTAPVGDKQSFIRMADGSYRRFYYFPTSGYLHIYNMNILNPDLDIFPDPTQYMIARRNEHLAECRVEIDNLHVVAPDAVKTQYEIFNYDQRGIDLILEGVEK